MTEIYLMSGCEGYKERALEVADGFLPKRDIAVRGWGPIIAELGLAGKKLWLVDDNEKVARSYVRRLAFDCGSVEYFQSPEEVLRRYQETRPDILLADIDMSGIDGIEFARRIRQIEMAEASP